MGMRLYPLPGGYLRQKFDTHFGLDMGMGMNFFYGNEYEIAKLVPAPLHCHP